MKFSVPEVGVWFAGTDIAFDEISIESEFATTRTVFGNKGLWTQDDGIFILRKLKDVTPQADDEYIFQVIACSSRRQPPCSFNVL